MAKTLVFCRRILSKAARWSEADAVTTPYRNSGMVTHQILAHCCNKNAAQHAGPKGHRKFCHCLQLSPFGNAGDPCMSLYTMSWLLYQHYATAMGQLSAQSSRSHPTQEMCGLAHLLWCSADWCHIKHQGFSSLVMVATGLIQAWTLVTHLSSMWHICVLPTTSVLSICQPDHLVKPPFQYMSHDGTSVQFSSSYIRKDGGPLLAFQRCPKVCRVCSAALTPSNFVCMSKPAFRCYQRQEAFDIVCWGPGLDRSSGPWGKGVGGWIQGQNGGGRGRGRSWGLHLEKCPGELCPPPLWQLPPAGRQSRPALPACGHCGCHSRHRPGEQAGKCQQGTGSLKFLDMVKQISSLLRTWQGLRLAMPHSHAGDNISHLPFLPGAVIFV